MIFVDNNGILIYGMIEKNNLLSYFFLYVKVVLLEVESNFI